MSNRRKPEADEVLQTALIAGATYTRAAEIGGVSRSALVRRMADPEFRRVVDEGRAAALRDVTAALGSVVPRSVEVIAEILNSPKASDALKLKAAGVALSNFHRFHEATEISERIDGLEAQVAAALDHEAKLH